MTAATSNKATLQNMQSKLAEMGGVSKVTIGEVAAVQSGQVAIVLESGQIPDATLSSPRETHIVTLRRYEVWGMADSEGVDLALDAWRAQILADLAGDFDLGGTVAYLLPVECSWAYGYQTINNTVHRILDIEIAYRIDDRASFVA